MDFDGALDLLDLPRTASWAQVRASYRSAMRSAHPDLGHGDDDRARLLNEAFGILEPVYRRGQPVPAPTPPAEEAAARSPGADVGSSPLEVVLVDDDGLALVAPPDEVFERLLDALHEFGKVTRSDAAANYLEVDLAGGSGTLSVSLQGRAFNTEAFFTLHTPFDVAPLPIDDVVRRIADRVRR